MPYRAGPSLWQDGAASRAWRRVDVLAVPAGAGKDGQPSASSVVAAKVIKAPKLRSMRASLRLLEGLSSTQRISAPSNTERYALARPNGALRSAAGNFDRPVRILLRKLDRRVHCRAARKCELVPLQPMLQGCRTLEAYH